MPCYVDNCGFRDKEGVEKDVVIQAQEAEIDAKQAKIERFKERERVFEEKRRHFATLRMRWQASEKR